MAHLKSLRRTEGWRRNPSVVLAVILTAQMMVVLDATIVNVALPHIQRSLGFSSSSLSWVLNAYVLTFGGLLLLGARAGDLLGRRRTFLAGITLFSLSSLAGGFATACWMLLTARALQGVGGALAAPAALALLTTVFPEGPQRVRAIGLFTTVSAAGAATGLVAGGLLTQWASWRWVMFVNVPIGLAVILVGRLVLGETERRHGRFDLMGALTSTAGMTAVVLGLVEAGSSGWSSPVTVASLAAGAVLLALFLRVESIAAEPILPLHLLANPVRSGANLARGLGYAGMYGMVFFLTQFLQDVQGHSALVTGLAFLPGADHRVPLLPADQPGAARTAAGEGDHGRRVGVLGRRTGLADPTARRNAVPRHFGRTAPHRRRPRHVVRQPDHRRPPRRRPRRRRRRLRAHQRVPAAGRRPRPGRPGDRLRRCDQGRPDGVWTRPGGIGRTRHRRGVHRRRGFRPGGPPDRGVHGAHPGTADRAGLHSTP